MTTPLRIAVVQPELTDGDRERNLRKLVSAIEDVGHCHDIVLLPETCTSGFASREDVDRLAEPLDGPTVQLWQELARKHGILIAAGLAERAPDGIYNTAVLVDEDGLRLAYRKTHLWLADRDKFLPGDRLAVTRWRGIALGPLICFDLEFPEVARALASLGAELLLVCNGNMDPYGLVHRTAALARAQENQVFLAMANRTGSGRADTFAGGSLVAGPDGRVLAELDTRESVLSVTIALAAVAEVRQTYDYLTLRRVPLGLEVVDSGRRSDGTHDGSSATGGSMVESGTREVLLPPVICGPGPQGFAPA